MPLDIKAQNPFIRMRMKMAQDGEFSLPAVGVTRTRHIQAGQEYVKFSGRCDNPDCYFMGGSFSTEKACQDWLNWHKTQSGSSIYGCPMPPHREILPSGNTYIEKLWSEMDDAIEAIVTNGEYRKMSGEYLKGYARGLAFNIVILDKPVWESVEAVAKHAMKRRKIRLGELPWEATPTVNKYNATIYETERLHLVGPTADRGPSRPAAKPTLPEPPMRRATAPRQAVTLPSSVTPAVREAIKGSSAAGFDNDTLAGLFKLTAQQVALILEGK